MADVPQCVFEHALLGGRLRDRVEMLHRATAAGAEVGAARRHALTAGAQHAADLRAFVAWLAAIDGIFDRFAGQRAIDEQRLAIDMGHAPAFVIERFNGGDWHASSGGLA